MVDSYEEVQKTRPARVMVWDSEAMPPSCDDILVFWRRIGTASLSGMISIPDLVEVNANKLRQRYLSWIYDLGETRIQNRRLIDHLELRPGFSYWWMTLLAEKCNFAKSKQIDDAIKLMAFESWLADQSCGHVTLITANTALAQSFKILCASKKIEFTFRAVPLTEKRSSWLRRAYEFMPLSLQPIVSLVRYLIERWPLKGVGLREWQHSEGQVTFVSYLFNLIPGAMSTGRFESNYWGHLPEELQRASCKTNWLHMYIKDASLPNTRKAARLIVNFNENGEGSQIHVTLDTFIKWGVVFKAIREWWRIRKMGEKLQKSVVNDHTTNSILWPLFQKDWNHSFKGWSALNVLLNVNLYEEAMAIIPNQRIGVYLQENQAWEFAFINSWNAAGHGTLVGTAHSTVRFWDLRYHFDVRSYNGEIGNVLPMPELVATNGLMARKEFLDGGFPVGKLVEVEALRYLYLEKLGGENHETTRRLDRYLTVLILADYVPHNTQVQLRMMEKAVTHLPLHTALIIKPHPSCPIELNDYPGLNGNVTTRALPDLFKECDIVFTSNVTSASVDAYCCNIPVVSILDSRSLNLSPLRGIEGVTFVATPEELVSSLTEFATNLQREDQEQYFFNLDSKLPRWRKLLEQTI